MADVMVRMYSILKEEVGTGAVPVTGSNVAEVLEDMKRKFGEKFTKTVCDKEGQVFPYFTLLVNGKVIDHKNPSATSVEDGDTVHIFPPIAGGRSEGEMNDDIQKILSMKTIAVVGCSPKPHRASHQVTSYLKQAGYQVIPVNPGHEKILGEICYPNLLEIPLRVEVVDIFRRPEHIFPIVKDAVAIGAKAIWMQDGIEHSLAAEVAKKAGLLVVMNNCMLREHQKIVKR